MSPSAKARDSHRAGLDRDLVVDCAARLVEQGGPQALTMRKLAGELGVTPTTLYWHVGNRDDIISAVVEREGERQAARTVEGDTGVQRVMSAARHVWASALDNPQITRLAYQNGATSLLELGLEVALVRELDRAGLRGEQARDALRSILLCVGGFLVLALRDPDSVRPDHTNAAMWATVPDLDVDRSTLEALGQPVDLDGLFETTVGAVVAHWVPEG